MVTKQASHKHWYVVCPDCDQDREEPRIVQQKDKPTHCPNCGNLYSDVYEQYTLFND